jgi:uncharacterized membrane protein YccC
VVKTRPDLAAYVLAALCVIAAVVCTVLHVSTPEFVPFIGLTAMGAGAGVSYAGSSSSSSPSSSAVKASSEPVTGVFSRVAP